MLKQRATPSAKLHLRIPRQCSQLKFRQRNPPSINSSKNMHYAYY